MENKSTATSSQCDKRAVHNALANACATVKATRCKWRRGHRLTPNYVAYTSGTPRLTTNVYRPTARCMSTTCSGRSSPGLTATSYSENMAEQTARTTDNNSSPGTA